MFKNIFKKKCCNNMQIEFIRSDAALECFMWKIIDNEFCIDYYERYKNLYCLKLSKNDVNFKLCFYINDYSMYEVCINCGNIKKYPQDYVDELFKKLIIEYELAKIKNRIENAY